MHWYASVILSAAASASALSQEQPAVHTTATIKEVLLGESSPDEKVGCRMTPGTLGAYTLDWIVSPDGERVAWCTKRGKTHVVVVNGEAGPAFDDVRDPMFSYDGRRLAYVAKKGKNSLVVLDQVQGPEYGDVWFLHFSPDSRRLAYTASCRVNGRYTEVVVVDGEEGPAYEPDRFSFRLPQITWQGSAMFSPDSRRMAYAIRRGEAMRMVIDGKEELTDYDEIGQPVFSPDSRHLAYLARRDKTWVVMADGKARPEFKGRGTVYATTPRHALRYGLSLFWLPQSDVAPVFSPNSERLAYVIGVDKIKTAVVIDGELRPVMHTILVDVEPVGQDLRRSLEGPLIRRIDRIGLVFSPDSRRVAYVDDQTRRMSVVLDGRHGLWFPNVGLPVFSSDGQHLTYPAQSASGRWSVVYDDSVLSPDFEGITEQRSVGDGLISVAWDSARETVFELRNGKIVREIPVPRGARGSRLVVHDVEFSPDGRRSVVVASWEGSLRSEQGRRVFVDGIEVGRHDAWGLFFRFSDDGRQLAYVVEHDKSPEGKSRVVLDGQAGKDYASVDSRSLRFSGENSVTYAAREGKVGQPDGRYLRVTQSSAKVP